MSHFRYEHASFRDGSEINYTFEHILLNNIEREFYNGGDVINWRSQLKVRVSEQVTPGVNVWNSRLDYLFGFVCCGIIPGYSFRFFIRPEMIGLTDTRDTKPNPRIHENVSNKVRRKPAPFI